MVDLTFETIWLFSKSVFPGTNLINVFPPREYFRFEPFARRLPLAISVRHIPSWFPIPILRELHKRCALSRDLLRRMQDIPFDSVRKSMVKTFLKA